MGGLIYDKLETYKDKVPVLGSIPLIGRLFRSEGERSVKRNLMIFVTATQVDVNGRRSSDVAAR
jgi:general secretion pathway protein D